LPRKSASGYSYDTIPAQLFIRLLQRDEVVAHRIMGRTAWEKIKAKWVEARDEETGEQLLEARRRYLLEVCKMNKVNLLIEWTKRAPEEKQKEVFAEIGISWIEDKPKRYKKLQGLLNKHLELTKKFKRAVEALEKPPEDGPGEGPAKFTLKDFYEGLASMETMGFHIEDYRTLPLSRYEALTAVAKKQMEARKKIADKNG